MYCTCHRPYPDPEDPVDDEMIQCVVCEDWYHGRHLGVDRPPAGSKYAEMVCQGCVKGSALLGKYSYLAVNLEDSKGDGESADVRFINIFVNDSCL